MLKFDVQTVPGREILQLPDVAQRKQHEEDVVFLVDPETDEYTQVRPDRQYDVKPGTALDVAPRTDRGGCPWEVG